MQEELTQIQTYINPQIWSGIKLDKHTETNIPMLAWLQMTSGLIRLYKTSTDSWSQVRDIDIKPVLVQNRCLDWFTLVDLREIYGYKYNEKVTFPLGLVAGGGNPEHGLWHDPVACRSLLFIARLRQDDDY